MSKFLLAQNTLFPINLLTSTPRPLFGTEVRNIVDYYDIITIDIMNTSERREKMGTSEGKMLHRPLVPEGAGDAYQIGPPPPHSFQVNLIRIKRFL